DVSRSYFRTSDEFYWGCQQNSLALGLTARVQACVCRWSNNGKTRNSTELPVWDMLTKQYASIGGEISTGAEYRAFVVEVIKGDGGGNLFTYVRFRTKEDLSGEG